MASERTATADVGAEHSSTRHNWIYRRAVLPILAMLRMGASPEKLAWSIALGLVIGINPILGSTTILCLAVAAILRLNIAASQIGNHIVYPLEILLVLPFIHLGTKLFHTAPIPLSTDELLASARRDPLGLLKHLWMWEWHAFVVWAALAAILTPLLALALTPLLRKLLRRIQSHQYPILSNS